MANVRQELVNPARFLAAAALLAGALMASGCGTMSRTPPVQFFNDMRQQLKVKPQTPSEFTGFSDGRSDRRRVPGTIARGEYQAASDDVFYTGVVNGNYTAKNPLKITPEVLELGGQRFNTYCQPCHGRLGDGKGIVAKKQPLWVPSSLIDDRVRAFADGDFFDVITHGRRSMPAYRFQVSEGDRWAIIAYVRALQRAAHATEEDVPQALRAQLH